MTIWEKAAVNMQRGSRRIAITAATFSERVKTEIAAVRLRIRIDELQARIDELHRTVGRRVAGLSRENALPDATEQLLKDEAVHAALSELVDRERELGDLQADLEGVYDEYRKTKKQTEDVLP